ncbi:hepatitis A virus cellular receptor 2 homolog [Leptodactylus fuscus]|uniref:hepatitis A virus cellular receptor 2 homolog n=1 Tax=Leptodactylus fuscus TaxID=238119 RepID=UPI003F4EA246
MTGCRGSEMTLRNQDLDMDRPGAEWTLHGQLSVTMSCAVFVLSILICGVLPFPSSADASGISSRFPTHILMNTSLQVVNPPVRMDLLSVRWEHNGRPLVEYKNGNLTFHSLWTKMSMEQLMQGNISLLLTNFTLQDAGNYTCDVEYGGVMQTIVYALIIEPTRISLLNITPPPKMAAVASIKSTKTKTFVYTKGKTNLMAKLGDNVTLPCLFRIGDSIDLSILVVHWSKNGVSKYFSNDTCCNFPGYGIPENDLERGRAPLQLVSVQEKDAGDYTCYIKYEDMEGSLTFKLIIQDGLPTPRPPTNNLRTATRDESRHEPLKYSLVSGVVAVTLLLAVFVYCCYEG